MKSGKIIGWTDTHAFMKCAERDLEIALQPIVDLNRGGVHAYEALVRNIDVFGVDTPAELYQLASRHECLLDLEGLVWRKACQKFSHLKDFHRLRLFLNIDGRSVAEGGLSLIDMICRALDSLDIRPGQICLELSEASDILMLQRMADVRAYAKKKSFRFAIDDFGKGYSQLKFMHELEPDLIKIDRFFIEGIDGDARKHLLVSSIAQLARRMGMRVVAEGIETAEELTACRALGADYAQGFFIGKPQTDLKTISEVSNLALLSVVNGQPEVDDDAALSTLEELPTVDVNDRPESVIQRFKDNSTLKVLPVVNGEHEPVGIIREEDLRHYLYNPYGHMLLRNSGIHDVMSGLIRKVPIADFRTSLSELVPAGAISDAECILITKAGRYIGIITTQALLRAANDDRVRQAEDQNPLTRLPGNRLIHKHIEAYGQRTEQDRYFFYFDFDAFKPFNDIYGFSAGDRAIQMFGDLLRTKLANYEAFIGHVGGDDFFVGLHGIDTELALETAKTLRSEFSGSVVSFYSLEDQNNGYLSSVDRDGNHVKHALLTCSVGIAHLKAGEQIEHLDQLGASISGIKKAAKAAPHGVVLRDMNGITAESPVKKLQASLKKLRV